MAGINVNIYVYCSKCNCPLEIEREVSDRDGDILLYVEPCPDCIKEAKEDKE